MFRKIKLFTIAFVAGALLGAGGTYYGLMHSSSKDLRKVKVTRIAGEEIAHRNYNYKGSSIAFITEAKGAGIAVTEIPKENIPEARAWMYNNHAIQASMYYQFHDRELYPFYGLAYYRRYGSLSLGGGILFSSQSLGLQAGAMLWW